VGADDALVDAAIALWVVAIGLGYGLYTPTLRNRISALAAECANSARYQALASRGQVVGGVLGVVALVILALMVFKPGL